MIARDLYYRLLFAVMAIFGPRLTISVFESDSQDLRECGFSVAVWSVISILYTIEWAIASYRKYCKVNDADQRRDA